MSGLTSKIVAGFMSKAWSGLLQLALIPLYLRFLGVEAYGVVGAFVTLQALMSLLDLGFGATLTRELASLSGKPHAGRQMRDLLRTLEIVYWAISVVIFLAVLAAAPAMSVHWLRPHDLSTVEVTRALTFAGLAFALQWPTNLYNSGLVGLQRQVTLAWIVAGAGTLRPVVSVLALWLVGPTLQVFFLAQACANAIQTVVTAVVLWRCLPLERHWPSFSAAALRGVLRFATGMTGISVTTVVLTQLDKTILSKTLTLQSFGYYAVASTLAAGLYVVISPLFSVLFPRFSQLVAQNERVAMANLYDLASQLISVILLPITAVVAIFAPEVLQLWSGNSVVAERSHLVLTLLILGNAMNGLANVPYALQLAHGWTSLVFYSNLVAILVCAPLTYFLSLRIGATGAALVWVLLTLVYLLGNLPLMHRRLLPGRLRRWYLVDVGGPALAAFAVAALGRATLPQSAPGIVTAVSLLCVAGAGCVAAALAAPDIRALLIRRMAHARAAG